MLAAIVLGGAALGCSRLPPAGETLTPMLRSPEIAGRIRFHRVSGEETLLDLTRRYDLGYGEVLAANPGVDPWLPGAGTRVLLPGAHLLPSGPREGIVINLADQRLYLFGEGSRTPSISVPIGVSRDGWSTPLGTTRIVRKRENPIWYPTHSARAEDPTLPDAVPPGPENPLGNHALYLAWPTYLIHGTNEPDGVGRRVSRGCIRLYPEDIARVFARARVDMPVRVVHEPVKLALIEGEVFLEVHPTLEQVGELEEKGGLKDIRPPDIRPQIREFAGPEGPRIDWRVAYRTAKERRGIPVRITR